MGDNRRSGSGSYLVMQQMKDTYHHVGRLGSSPSARMQATRFGSPSGQHLLSEIQRLQTMNAKLNAKLAFAANRVPGLNKMLGMKESSDGGLPPTGSGPLGRREDSATAAAGKAPRASAETGSGPGIDLFIDDLLLSEEEVQEAAMRCCWLARYWTLAEQLGICDDIAHEKATYWRALALPLPTYFEVAKCAVMPHVMVKQSTKPREASCQMADGPTQLPAVGSLTTHAPAEQVSSELLVAMPEGGGGGGATVADVVELERALRQLSELGVVQEVLSSLMHQRQAVYTAQLQASIENCDPDETPTPPKAQPGLSAISNTAVAGSMQHGSSFSVEVRQAEEDAPPSSSGSITETSACEAQEVAFQRAWLAYMWSRAAALGVEPQVCRERAEHWGHLLLWGSADLAAHPHARDSPFAAAHNQAASSSVNLGSPGAALHQQQPSIGASTIGTHAKELMEVHAGLQELARLGVEQQIW
eukprot:CAMPEP_0202390218 /NCGR_PEP_ID=MMETSP1127-20130417/87317_1 /ASSEMBLY_ACC=CAM_ASM_000462 /TAXON_ID=3047 /ORGANISM="Dunaliella tertiolecta, Strain CCMP1320" /LENGTH=473 /DNA_ID=CAMNT_0048992291 /DNA_START=863 /DNA_END=2281 /DNA_ORIENTATION=-